jgi:hypothetical protein
MFESLVAVITKLASIQWVSAIGSSAIVASIAALIRVIFSPKRGWLPSLGTFFGGVLVGTLVGFIVNDISVLRDYSSAIVAAASIGAREFVEWIIERFQELKRMKFAYFLSDEKYKDYARGKSRESREEAERLRKMTPRQIEAERLQSLNKKDDDEHHNEVPFDETNPDVDSWADGVNKRG